METVERNFGLDVHHFIRIHFEGFQAFIDSLGGIEVELEESIGGYPPGRHHLDGEAALAFVRDRAGTDDFFRMRQGQILLRSLLSRITAPQSWSKLPRAFLTVGAALETDIPVWKLPMIALALLRNGADGIEFQVIDRGMVQGFTTAQGAQVLAPIWPAINPLIGKIFNP
jgi:anionic cell wall polymer biosynthesis LytR-Cps2A-Psr (LCP) family protein